jgi:23S rRNA (uracil1939-C5)-methyltransferase
MPRYESTLAKKTSALKEDLARIPGVSLFPHIHPSSFENGYRNRAKFKIFAKDSGPALYGTDPVKGEVQAGEMLWILPDWGRAVVEESFQLIRRKYSEYPVDGFELQLTHGGRKAHIALSVNKKHRFNYADLTEELLQTIPALLGIAVPSHKFEAGESFLPHIILDKPFFSHYSCFFQSNLKLTPALLESAVAMLEGRRFAGVCDLYCGVGLFCLMLGEKAAPILGIDSHPQAISSARSNAQRLGFRQTGFICSDVQNYLSETEISAGGLLILDPPRTGCPSCVLKKVVRSDPEYILMVSCFWDTQIRDLAVMRKSGFAVIALAAFDMFPYTRFLETMALLRRK